MIDADIVVFGNEDGAHHCIAEILAAANDIGFTAPARNWTYWNRGPGPGEEEYTSSAEHEWTHGTGDAMAHVLVHTARTLAAHAIPAPPE